MPFCVFLWRLPGSSKVKLCWPGLQRRRGNPPDHRLSPSTDDYRPRDQWLWNGSVKTTTGDLGFRVMANASGPGVNTSVVPVYQSECVKASIRGRLVILANISNTVAFCLANWMNYGISFHGGPFQWRFPLAFQLVFAMIAIPIMIYLPESPRWLLLKDRSEEALEVLARLQGKGVKPTDPVVIEAHDSILVAIQEERRDVVPAKDVLLFRDETQNLRRLILSCGTQLMQQFSGVNALGYYLPTLLQQSVGFSETMARLLTACNSTSYLGAAIFCVIIIDMAGRRKYALSSHFINSG